LLDRYGLLTPTPWRSLTVNQTLVNDVKTAANNQQPIINDLTKSERHGVQLLLSTNFPQINRYTKWEAHEMPNVRHGMKQ
jgi:hypothetical protein